MDKRLALLVAMFLIWFFFYREPTVTHGPGVTAPDEPVQRSAPSNDRFQIEQFSVTPLASFEIKARVLSRQTYHTDRESAISPIDLVLGWGNMSDESIINRLSISQSGRWYRWRADANELPISRREVETHSANMHMIPANDAIARKLDQVRKGDIVSLSGQLVKVTDDTGWRWESSLTRNDTGGGACELIYVESLDIAP